jgi:hypothetical protein
MKEQRPDVHLASWLAYGGKRGRDPALRESSPRLRPSWLSNDGEGEDVCDTIVTPDPVRGRSPGDILPPSPACPAGRP